MPLGGLALPAGEGTLRFPKSPWLEVEALLLDRLDGPELSRLAREPAQDQSGGRKGGRLLVVGAGLVLAAALWAALRRGRAARLARGVADWLDAWPEGERRLVPLAAWAAVLAGSLAAGFLLGAPAARLVAMAGSLAALPLWRGLRPRVARALPVVAKRATLHYCTGFLAAVCLAALLRPAGLPPLSEYLGLCGMWLFLGAWAVRSRPDPSASGSHA